MAGMVLASVPVNSEGGSYLTFAIPVGLFCVIGAILYVLLFGRPHARVPARRITAAAHAGPPNPDAGAVSAATSSTGNVADTGGVEPGGPAEGVTSAESTAPTEGDAPTEGTEASE